MDAPKRTPLSEEMRAAGTQTTYPDSAKGHLLYFAGRVAALEQECEHQREIINGSDHLSRIAALEQAIRKYFQGEGHYPGYGNELLDQVCRDTEGE